MKSSAFFILGLILPLYGHTYAQTGNEQRNNLQQVKTIFESGRFRLVSKDDYKLPKDVLIQRYSFNDTARAIINMYSERFSYSRIIHGTTLGILTMIRAAGPVQTNEPGQPPATTTYHPWVYPALGIATVSLITGVVYQSGYDRKSLVEKLIEYEAAKGGLDKKTLSRLRPRHFR
jgi:hypothetical protein